MNIFISYSHTDNEFALKLSSALESDGYNVFIDNKIPIGNNIYKDIGKGIAKADAVIVVISKKKALCPLPSGKAGTSHTGHGGKAGGGRSHLQVLYAPGF